MRILIAEDNLTLAQSLRRGLEEAGYSVRLAHDGQETERLVAEGPDLILLDRMLPGRSGDEVCRGLRRRGSSIPVLMLTARAEIGDRVQGLDLGADDYLTKPFAFDELLARIRALLRRRGLRGPGNATNRLAGLSLDPVARTVSGDDREVTLTVREFALLSLLAQREGEVVRREDILRTVWGKSDPASTSVIEVYITYVRRKLRKVHDGPLIRNVRGVGYMLKEPP